MVKITIGFDERSLKDVDESWISRMVNSRKKDQQQVVVKVFIEAENINMVLSTPDLCRQGGTRRPNPKEDELYAIWESKGLSSNTFTVGGIMSFLQKIRCFA